MRRVLITFAVLGVLGASFLISVTWMRRNLSWCDYYFQGFSLGGRVQQQRLQFSSFRWNAGGTPIALCLPDSRVLDISHLRRSDVQEAGFLEDSLLEGDVHGLEIPGGHVSVEFRANAVDSVVVMAYANATVGSCRVMFLDRSVSVTLPIDADEAFTKLGAPLRTTSQVVWK